MYSESDSDFEEAGELDPLDAGKEFADFLLELRMLQKLSARDVCLLAYYAKHAGVVGYARDYAFPPGKRSGHYQRHLDTVTNMSTTLDQKYVMEVPGSTKFYNARTKLQLPCLPPHECLQAEVSESPNLREDLRDALSQEPDWLDTYTAHPVVTSAKPGEVVYPLAIYSDGVPFQRRDGALLFFIYNLVSGTRHLVATLRKSELCKCGCLGYCSVFQVWLLFKWGIMAFQCKLTPRTKRGSKTRFLVVQFSHPKNNLPLLLLVCGVGSQFMSKRSDVAVVRSIHRRKRIHQP